MKSTLPNGSLKAITDCYISIPRYKKIYMYILPDISDSKSAQYSDEAIIGRSSPFKTYSHSENRTISWTAYFMTTHDNPNRDGSAIMNLRNLRAIQSVTYPRDKPAPYAPPPVCSIKCGSILGNEELCVVLRSYTVKFPTDVSWDEETLLPYKFSVDMSWDVVYQSDQLPGWANIIDPDGWWNINN